MATTPVRQQVAFPEVAIIRKGTPKQKKNDRLIQGMDLGDKFRIHFLPGTQEARDMFRQLHPEAYKIYGDEYAIKDGFEIARLRCMIVYRTVWEAWSWSNKAFDAAGRLMAEATDGQYLTLRDGNGQYVIRNGEPYREFHYGDCVEYDRGERHFSLPIKAAGMLDLFLPEMNRLVSFTIKTTSFYDRLNIEAQLGSIQAIADSLNRGNAGGVPFFVYRIPRDITWNKPDGTAARVQKWLINIEADPEWVKSAVQRMGAFALTGEVSTGPLLPVGDLIGDTDPDKETFDDEETIETDIVTDSSPTPAPTSAPVTPAPVVTSVPPIQQVQKAERPLGPEKLKASIVKRAFDYNQEFARNKSKFKANERNVLAAGLEKVFGLDTNGKLMRYATCAWLADAASTKVMSPGYVRALQDWIGIHDFDGDPEPVVMEEAKQAYAEALRVKGQMEMPGMEEGKQ